MLSANFASPLLKKIITNKLNREKSADAKSPKRRPMPTETSSESILPFLKPSSPQSSSSYSAHSTSAAGHTECESQKQTRSKRKRSPIDFALQFSDFSSMNVSEFVSAFPSLEHNNNEYNLLKVYLRRHYLEDVPTPSPLVSKLLETKDYTITKDIVDLKELDVQVVDSRVLLSDNESVGGIEGWEDVAERDDNEDEVRHEEKHRLRLEGYIVAKLQLFQITIRDLQTNGFYNDICKTFFNNWVSLCFYPSEATDFMIRISTSVSMKQQTSMKGLKIKECFCYQNDDYSFSLMGIPDGTVHFIKDKANIPLVLFEGKNEDRYGEGQLLCAMISALILHNLKKKIFGLLLSPTYLIIIKCEVKDSNIIVSEYQKLQHFCREKLFIKYIDLFREALCL